MDRLKGLMKQLRAALRSDAAERDLRDELAFHLEQETERHRRSGTSAGEARRLAALSFGPAEAVKEEMRGAGLAGVLAGAARDMRHMMRGMRRRPGLALTVVLTLGLGIGISTAMYSVVHATVMRPLPYPAADRLIAVWQTYPGWRGRPILGDTWDRIGLSWPEYESWRARQRAFEDVAVFAGARMTVSDGIAPEVVRVGRASGSLWRLLGISPAAGRLFAESEAGAGAEPIAVLSHGIWRRRFGGDPAAVGRTLRVDETSFTIVGVLPDDFRFGGEQGTPVEVWVPVGSGGMPLDEDNHSFAAFGRLRPGIGLAAASDETGALFLGDRRPGSRGASLVPYFDQVVGTSRQPLLGLLAGTFVLLLIAWVNVGALLAGDAARRGHEIATRRALGASRARVIRQFVAEALALSLAAAAVGIGVAALAVPGLVTLAPPDLPRLQEVGISPGILAFAVSSALVTTLICSAASVIAAEWRGESAGAGPGLRVIGGGRRLQPVFVGVQLALLTVLGIAGALLGRSLYAMQAVDPGFATAHVLTAVIAVPGDRFGTRAELVEFYRRLAGSVGAIPGVEAVSGVSTAPFADGSDSTSVGIEGLPETGAKPEMERRTVLPGFFDLTRIPVRQGSAALTGEVPNVVVSELMAARLWPGQPAVEQRISLRGEWYTVEGVVADVRDQALTSAPRGTYYVSQRAGRETAARMRLLIRTGVEPTSIADRVRDVAAEADATIPVGEIAPLELLMARSLSAERYRAVLVNIFAGAALLLAAVGVFGVTLRVMVRRRRELGVRLALGARPAGVAAAALGSTALGAVAGLSVGAAAAALVLPVLSTYLYDLPARDAGTYLGTAAVLFAVALAATAIPVVRGSRMNIVQVLRED